MDGWKCWFYGMNLMILHFAKLSQGEKVTFMGEKPTTTKEPFWGVMLLWCKS